MGRIREMMNVNGRDSWTLFNTGARNTYIVPAVAAVPTVHKARYPYRTALGGGARIATETAILEAELKELYAKVRNVPASKAKMGEKAEFTLRD